MTAFTLQAIRVFLLVIKVPEAALSIQYLERFLTLFFSLFTLFQGAPMWVQQPPGRGNLLWLMIAQVFIYTIAYEVKNWSSAWMLTVGHFVVFVTFAGPITPRPFRERPVEPDPREVYQKQALVALSSLGLSFALTLTHEWPIYLRYIVVGTMFVIFFVTVRKSQGAADAVVYEGGPSILSQAVVGGIFLAIFLAFMIGDMVWYWKWPLIILFSFAANFSRGVYEVMTRHLYEEADRPPEPPRQANNDHNNDPEPDGMELFVDNYRELDALPAPLANLGPFPTNNELTALFWYRHLLQARLRSLELPPHQRYYVGRRVYEIITPDDIVKTSYDDAVLEDYIRRALQYERVYNPDFI
ncbi:hypothetical protein F4680DRAFT_468854 [Xylaria scruposa]|nr:hypothetical protein F4680DRAFT_468854 [Xylaria scruposa]